MYKHIPETVVSASIVASILLVSTIGIESGLVFDPPYLAVILQLVFITIGYSMIAYIAGKSYLKTGSSIFLFIGAAQIAAATGSTYAFLNLANLNFAATLHNSGFLLSAVLQVASAGLATWFATESGRA